MEKMLDTWKLECYGLINNRFTIKLPATKANPVRTGDAKL
jgi:hypothetical protein